MAFLPSISWKMATKRINSLSKTKMATIDAANQRILKFISLQEAGS